jgi:hypothetical protein
VPSDQEKIRRTKITRKSIEMPKELNARLIVAARARGVSQAVLIRTVLTDWLIANTAMPTFNGPPLEASAEAYAAGRTVTRIPHPFAELLTPGGAKV